MGYNDPRDPNFLVNQARAAQYTPGVSDPAGTPVDKTPHFQGSDSPGMGPAVMTASQVRSMQQFLNNHGFQVAQDGIMGHLTKSAAQAFRADHKGGDAWNKANGIGVHPAVRPSPDTGFRSASLTPDTGGGKDGGGGGGGAGGGSQLQSLLQSLLSGGGNVGTGYDAQSFGDAAAAPSAALAQALTRQIGANPKQEAQNQSDISSWYGLDPKASSYKLSVLGRLAQAKAGDAQATTDVSGNMADLAKSLAGSIGGAANDGSGSVLAAGQNSAGTIQALGQAQSDYQSNMDPLLRAEATGAASREKGSNSQALLDLQDKLAAAQGQGRADRAGGVMGATDKNNALAQQRFANQGNLLSTLAQMQASDPNAPTLANAKTKAQIGEINSQAARARAAAQHLVGGAAAPKYDLQAAANRTAGLLGVGADANGQLPAGTSVTKLAYTIGSVLEGMGLKKGTPDYQRAAQTLISNFRDPSGNPINVPGSWFGPNS